MNPERWRQVDELFGAALELSPPRRGRFLESACGDDRALLSEVEALLASESDLEHFLEAPAVAVAGAARGAGETVGARLGPYRIEREIDRGGMGTVYLATRADEEFARRVAIKVLHPGIKSASLIRRFHSERQILAGLDHPSIARLFDGATTEDGRPYLIMEYIDGVPLDEHCDRQRLSLRHRIELFREVCSAVHYAHQNLVVHRDIKPSNILVTAEGAPRLLDFGIAKLLDPNSFPLTVEATDTGARPMTPHYASPEQVRGEAITTASDVYSLGVLLYLLLTGRAPYRVANLPALEIERILTEEDPPRPSDAVTWAEETETEPSEVSRNRGTGLHKLRRRLAGDLDNIVLMALRKDPGRRYGSVEQLSEDLRRHLAGLPVSARGDSVGYRLRSFLSRHRLVVAFASVILALIMAFALTTARQAADTARLRDLAEAERDKAEQVSEFLVGLFKEVDPWAVDGNTVTAREVLDRGTEKVERQLADQPEIRASLLDAIGTVYLHLGLYDQATLPLETALASREALYGAAHLDVATSLHHVASLRRHQGRYDESEKLFLRALAIRDANGMDDDPDTAINLRSLATLYRIQGRFDDSEDYGQRALTMLERTLGANDPEVARGLRTLAGIHARRGDHRQAEELLEKALIIDRRVFGELHWSTASTYNNLGYLLRERGEHAAAEDSYRRALAVWERLRPEGHPRVADAQVGLANTYKAQRRYADAEAHLRLALPLYEQQLGDEHALVANCLYELGNVLFLQSHIAQAEPYLQRSLAVRERVFPASHPWLAESLRGLADLRRSQHRDADAERLLQRAMTIWEKHPHHEGTRDIPRSYVALMRTTGRLSEAADLEARAQNLR